MMPAKHFLLRDEYPLNICVSFDGMCNEKVLLCLVYFNRYAAHG